MMGRCEPSTADRPDQVRPKRHSLFGSGVGTEFLDLPTSSGLTTLEAAIISRRLLRDLGVGPRTGRIAVRSLEHNGFPAKDPLFGNKRVGQC